MAFKAVNNFGLDADLAKKMQDKYDKGLEERIQVWMEEVTGVTFDKDFGEMIKDGILLCELVNKMLPGRIKKINRTGGLFRMQENVTNFIKTCRAIGVPEASLFPTESLSQLKDLGQVLVTINAFSLVVQKNKDDLGTSYNGPWLGGELSSAAKKGVSFKPSMPTKSGGNIQKKKSKWVVKPGGSGGVSLLNKGSAGIMEESKYVNAREQIKRGQLDGKGASNDVSALNQGSAGIMEESKHVDAREQIKRGQLDGKGAQGEVSALNQGSAGIMENLTTVDPREKIKRGEL